MCFIAKEESTRQLEETNPRHSGLLGLLLGFLGSSFLHLFFESTLGFASCVEIKAVVVVADHLDVASFVKLFNQTTCNWSVHLKLFAEYSSSDAKDLWRFREDLVVFLLLKEYFVVGFVFGDSLSPLFASFLYSSSLLSLCTLRCTRRLLCNTLILVFTSLPNRNTPN